VHDYLHGMLARRHRTERSIEATQVNEAPDGTRLERDEAAVEVEYHKLNRFYDEINRAMLTAYAQFLTATPLALSVATTHVRPRHKSNRAPRQSHSL
jgi:hypothetical protein